MSILLKPIGGSYALVALASVAVLALTIWAYRRQLRGTSGSWRWLAFGLRIAAVVLCLLAALRPSLMLEEKAKRKSAFIFLIDSSESMGIGDEAGARTRWSVAKEALDSAVKEVSGAFKEVEIKVLKFDGDLHEYKAGDDKPPDGRSTELGSMMLKAAKDSQGASVAALVVLADGASNGGVPPLVAARQLRAQTVPVVTVGVGTADAGKGSKDIAVRDLVAGPTVFVKNQPEIRATINARGYAGQTIEVELYVDREARPVASKSIKVPEGNEAVIPVAGLKYIPETPGEKRVRLKVKPMGGEMVATNNEISTYLDVLKGGLRVLYVQGADFSWEPKFLTRALDAAREIHADLKVVHEPARGEKGLLDDADFAPGQYDVYILGGLAANYMTRLQVAALKESVEKGAGLIMLGGRSSFGPGGWSSTPLAGLLPVNIGPNDGQVEPEEGLKVVPEAQGLENFVTRLAPTSAETAKAWDSLPPITGTNLFGALKPNAFLLAKAGQYPVMVGMDNVGKGRVLAFGGETWSWARATVAGKLAHARFWRQAILWLARKEDQGESNVKLKLGARRVAVGQKLDIAATARDPKNEPIPDATFTTTVTRLDDNGKPDPKAKPEEVTLFSQGLDSRGAYFAANAQPGEYEVITKGAKAGKEIGTDTSRFMVYQDDREMANPAADRDLLKQISVITGGSALQAEELTKHLKALTPEATDYVVQTEHRIWDNWPFFLVFAAILTAEWALRKAKGWV